MRYKIVSGKYTISYLDGAGYNSIFSWKWVVSGDPCWSGVATYSNIISAAKCITDYAIRENLPDDAAEWHLQIEPYTDPDRRGIMYRHDFTVDSGRAFDRTNYAKYEEVT